MRHFPLTCRVCVLVLCLAGSGLFAAELTSDGNTLLLLHFNNTLTGANGEAPVGSVSGISYDSGIFGNGAVFSASNKLQYARTDNIDSQTGTLEFWIKPQWNGNDGADHYVFALGVAGGMLMGKDGGNYWKCLFNRYGAGGSPESGCGIPISNDWEAGHWYHAAFTWDANYLKIYVNGELKNQQTLTAPLPSVLETNFYLGSDNGNAGVAAVIDELRISDIARTADEISASYIAGLTVTGLNVTPESLSLLCTWWAYPELTVTTAQGSHSIPASAAQWSSNHAAVADVDELGKIIAGQAGTAVITASYEGYTDTVTVTVSDPVRPPQVESIDSYLATPAAGHLQTIPVLILRYLPTRDGTTVDTAETGWTSSLNELKAHIDRLTIQTKFILEEGSRFRGYRHPGAVPSIGYQVIRIVTVYEELPKERQVPWNPGVFFPDYNQILDRADIEHYVNDLGVKEVWIWGYHHGDIEQPESNMSSPLTGDVSNSSRFNDDLPILDHTYTVYGYNFTRSACESAHDHGHQLEAILSYANQLQDGQADLFWKQFVGQNAGGAFITGRCGWTHMPPNTTEDYNYWSTTQVNSDIEDWRPDGTGEKIKVNANTWGGIAYAWPDGVAPDDLIQAQWYIYWMQNMPGHNNGISYGTEFMTNWWRFTADWDAAIGADLGLHAPATTAYGDFDGDGHCDATDAILLADYLCGNMSGLDDLLVEADVRVDLHIKSSDLVVLQCYLAGRLPTLPLRD